MNVKVVRSAREDLWRRRRDVVGRLGIDEDTLRLRPAGVSRSCPTSPGSSLDDPGLAARSSIGHTLLRAVVASRLTCSVIDGHRYTLVS